MMRYRVIRSGKSAPKQIPGMARVVTALTKLNGGFGSGPVLRESPGIFQLINELYWVEWPRSAQGV